MNPLIETRHEELTQLCRRHSVRRLDVFGSACEDRFDAETSDIDFLVEFIPMEPGQYSDCYFGLLFGLEDLFGCSVDLVYRSRHSQSAFPSERRRHAKGTLCGGKPGSFCLTFSTLTSAWADSSRERIDEPS